jgi:peptide deformylase
MYENLVIIHWPDPRLKKPSAPVERFDDRLRLLANRMLQLMHESKGVGLAAPQVGINVRLFVMNPTGQPQDDRVYVNPQLSEADGEEEAEEGCLSLPGIYIPVTRFTTLRMNAQDLDGNPFEQLESGFLARVWQHEVDHLNGMLLTDRMGALAKLSHRKKLRELQDSYAKAHPEAAQEKSTVKRRPTRLLRK